MGYIYIRFISGRLSQFYLVANSSEIVPFGTEIKHPLSGRKRYYQNNSNNFIRIFSFIFDSKIVKKEKKKINKSLPPQMEEHYFKRRIITRNLKALLHILNCKYSPHGNLRSRIFAVSWHTIQTNFTNDEAKKKKKFSSTS